MESAGALLVVPRRSSHSPNLTDAVAAAAPLEGTEREEKDRPCIAACREKESDPPPPQARLKDPTTTWDVLLTPEALWFRVHEDQQHEEEGCSAAAAAAAAGSPIASPRTAPPLPAPALDRMERVRGLSVSSDRCGIHPWYAVPAVRRMLGMPDEDKDKFAQARSSPLLPSPPLLLSDQTLQSLRRRRELYWAKLGLALSAQLLGLGYLTFVTYGWDVMEPVCYFLTSTIALTGAALGIARTKPPRCSDGRHHGGEEGNGHAAPMTPFARTSTATMTTSSSSTGAAAAVMMGPREEEAMVVESAYFASPEAEQDAWHSAWAARTATVDDASVRWWQASEKVRGRLQ